MAEPSETDSAGASASEGGQLQRYVPSAQRVYQVAVESPEFCTYCGARLDPFYYFCIRCSQPYKQLEAITGTVRPAPLTDGQRIERMAPHTWTVFWTYAAVVVGCALMTLPFGRKTGESPLFYFLSTLAIFFTTVIFTAIHWRPLVAQLKTSGFMKWEAWAGIGALVPLLLVNFSIHLVARKLLPHEASDPLEGMTLAGAVVVFCVFPAITEEIAFRGLVQYWLEVALTPMKALMLGSAMFAGLHLNVVGFPYLFAVGVTLAWVRRRTGSLYPGILIHFLHNLAVITLFRLV